MVKAVGRLKEIVMTIDPQVFGTPDRIVCDVGLSVMDICTCSSG